MTIIQISMRMTGVLAAKMVRPKVCMVGGWCMKTGHLISKLKIIGLVAIRNAKVNKLLHISLISECANYKPKGLPHILKFSLNNTQ